MNRVAAPPPPPGPAYFAETIAKINELVADLNAITARAQEFRQKWALRAALASEPDVLPKWPKRPRKRLALPTGEIAEAAKGRTLCTTYLRTAYNAADVKLLQQVIDAKKEWTFAEVRRKNELRRKP